MNIRTSAITDQFTMLVFLVPLLLSLQSSSQEISHRYVSTRRTRRQQQPSGFDLSQTSSRHVITVTFINKSGRRVKLYQSGPYGLEILYQFLLRPNEPRTIRFLPDRSYWIPYDALTNKEMLINGGKKLETAFIRPGMPFDARIHSHELRPEPYPMGKLLPRFVEILVILDTSMLEYYKGSNIEKYALTLMNIATRAYMHHSLGVPLFMVIVGIEKMTVKPTYYNIIKDKPHLSVRGGCTFAKTFHKRYMHDFAIILTREDIGPSGFASMYTMCTKRSCGLVRDKGLDSGYVVAHELGHALGIDHDESDRCIMENRIGGHIMAQRLYATNSNFRWSKCSQRMLRQNLRYFRCLKNKPRNGKMLSSFKKIMFNLPGVQYNTAEQCRLYHGNSSTECKHSLLSGSCSFLLCHRTPKSLCRPTKWHAPLEGTQCGQGENWCVHGSCIEKVKMLPVDGNWTSWTGFQPPCPKNGSMVHMQERKRECTNPKPQNGGRKCVGDAVMYRAVIPYGNGICTPYSLKNMMTRKKHEGFRNRFTKLMGDGKAVLLPSRPMNFVNPMMFPCASSQANNKVWKEYPAYLQVQYILSKNFSCDFEKPGCGWKSSPLGSKHWDIGQGSTPSYETGPPHDHTFKNRTGRYIYLEASYVEDSKPLRKGDRIIFESPLVLSSSICLKFAYHMRGSSMGNLEVRVRNGKHSRRMWRKKGAQGNQWHIAEINLAINIEYNITIEAIRGSYYYSDIAIDDITVTPGSCKNTTNVHKCTSVCVDTKQTSMLRLQLPNGTPCRNSLYRNNVCLNKACKPVNCRGIVGKTAC